MIILVGLTHSNRSLGYSSFDDGWRPEAQQTVIPLQLPETTRATPQELAEAVFAATNTPGGVVWPGIVEVRQVIARWAGRPPAGWRTVSTGDTVTVDTTTFACTEEGWRKVIPTLDPARAGLLHLADAVRRPYPTAAELVYTRDDNTSQLQLLEIRDDRGRILWARTDGRETTAAGPSAHLLLARALVTTTETGRRLVLQLPTTTVDSTVESPTP